jgi:hypothetical protein
MFQVSIPIAIGIETIKTLNKNKDDFRNESPITRGVNKRS